MSQLRFSNGYNSMPDSKLIEKAYFIHQQVSSRATMFPNPTPTMTALNTACDAYFAAWQAAKGGDKVLIEQKNVARQTVIAMLYQLGHYVLMVANGNRLVAVESGITLAKEPSPIVITRPVDLKAEYGRQPGELVVSVKGVKGAASYIHQYTTDPTLKEENWTIIYCTQAKCTLEGLTPGTTYYLRVGAVGKDQVLYSDVASKMAT